MALIALKVEDESKFNKIIKLLETGIKGDSIINIITIIPSIHTTNRIVNDIFAHNQSSLIIIKESHVYTYYDECEDIISDDDLPCLSVYVYLTDKDDTYDVCIKDTSSDFLIYTTILLNYINISCKTVTIGLNIMGNDLLKEVLDFISNICSYDIYPKDEIYSEYIHSLENDNEEESLSNFIKDIKNIESSHKTSLIIVLEHYGYIYEDVDGRFVVKNLTSIHSDEIIYKFVYYIVSTILEN